MKEYRILNNDQIPALGLGTWKSEPGEVYNAIREAIKIGYRHFDCAAVYGNEKEIGNAFADAFKDGDVKRKDLWITSKLWNDSHKKEDVKSALEKSLSDLQLDYLDLYLIHWPVAFKKGIGFPQSSDEYLSLSEVPTAETWSALEACVHADLTKHIGVSNFSVKKIKDLLKICKIRPAVNQIELHPFLQQNDMLEFCNSENIILTAYSPLGSSDRPAAFKAENEPSLLENSVISEIAKGKGLSAAQVLIAWAIQRGTSVIPKSVNPARLKQNIDAASLNLTEEEMTKIADLDMHARYVVGEFFNAEEKGYNVQTLWDE